VGHGDNILLLDGVEESKVVKFEINNPLVLSGLFDFKKERLDE
jgi:hypothetical protein